MSYSRFHPLLTLNFLAGAAVEAYKFVKLSSDTAVIKGAAAIDACIGVSGALDTDSGDPCPVIACGVAEVKSGGTITRGQFVTCDANGDAVATDGFTVTQAVIAGGSAGALTVTGIATTDELVSVIVLDRDATAANINLVDLTSEFSISAADTITNAGGTATTGNTLLVTYRTPTQVLGRALASAVDNDILPILLGR